jgi:hypothetical protein
VKGPTFKKVETEHENAEWSLPFLPAHFTEMRGLKERKLMGGFREWSGRENGNNCLPFTQMMNNKMR